MANEEMGFSRRNLLKGIGGVAAAVAGGSALAACSNASDRDDVASGGGGATSTSQGDDRQTVQLAAEGDDVDLGSIAPDKKIGVVALVLSSEGPGRGKTEWERIAGDIRWDFEFADANGDASRIPAAVQDFVTKRKDAIVAWVFPGVLLGDGVRAAQEANIPIVGGFTGAGPGITARVDPSEWISQARIGEYTTQRMNYEGKIALLNWEEIPPLAVRGKVMRDMLASYPGIQVVSDQVLQVPGQVADAKAKAAAVLSQHRDLKAIWAGWDEVGVAAAQAVSEAGRQNDVFVTSIDGNVSTFEAMRSGEPLAATCANDLELVARLCVQNIDRLLKGEKVPATTNVDSPFVTKENLPPTGQTVKGRVTPFYGA